MFKNLFAPRVFVNDWVLDKNKIDFKKLSLEKKQNIEFLINYKNKIRKIRILFCGVIPFIALFSYGVFSITIAIVRLPWPSDQGDSGSWATWPYFVGIIMFLSLFVIEMIVYGVVKNYYINWNNYRKRLWLIAKKEHLEKIYYRSEFWCLSAGRTPSIPYFYFDVQKSLNRMIYFHIYDYVPSQAEISHEKKATRKQWIERPEHLNSYDRFNRAKLEENKSDK